MAVKFNEQQLQQLRNDYYGGYKTNSTTERVGHGRYGTKQDKTFTTTDTGYYKQNDAWSQIANDLGIKNVNSINDLGQLHNYYDQNYNGRSSGGGNPAQPAPTPPPGPGDPGYSNTPNQTYGNGASQNAQQANAAAQQKYAAEYAAYNESAIAAQVRNSKNISTAFYNSAYGQAPTRGETMFGHADLAGNLGNGISATQLLEYFDSNGGSTLNTDQKQGTGGIYDQVAGLAAAEKPVETLPLPDAIKPGKMMIGASQVGDAGNASGVRSKRSTGSKTGRNSGGTSQLNRSNFGKSKSSPLSISGLTI